MYDFNIITQNFCSNFIKQIFFVSKKINAAQKWQNKTFSVSDVICIEVCSVQKFLNLMFSADTNTGLSNNGKGLHKNKFLNS